MIIEGSFSIPNSIENFNLFNYKNYLLSKKIHYIVQTKKVTIVDKKTNIFYFLKNKIYDYINNKKSNTYLKSFILGDTSLIDDKIMESYKNNGIIHLFSISGMHISIFAAFLLYVLKRIIKSDYIIHIVTCFILLFYCFITNFNISTIRAILTFFLLYFNKYYKLGFKNYYIVIYIFIIALFVNPFSIFNSGFLYTYIISFYLMKYSIHNNNYIIGLLNISMISFLAGLPITINSNHCINILSPIINIIFVPLVSLLIFPLSVFSLFIPFIDRLFILLTYILEQFSLFISNYKIFVFTLSHLSFISFVIYYCLMTIIVKNISNKKYYYLLFIILIVIIHNNIQLFNNSYFLHYINVGQGDSILLSFPHNNGNILIDTGGNKNTNVTKKILIPYLKSFGINKLHYLVLSHGDYDHVGEAINLVNNFKVEKVIFNCGEYNDLEKELIKVLDKKKIKYYSCIKELNIDKNKLYFLQTKEYDNENDNSNVIYTVLDGYKFMFMGDASITTEKEILDKYNLPDIDVLKVGHHGSKTSSSNELINEINPKYSIISVGKNNCYGHPNKEVLNNLNKSKIYRTDQDGSIMFKIKNNKLKIETCNP